LPKEKKRPEELKKAIRDMKEQQARHESEQGKVRSRIAGYLRKLYDK